MTFCNNFSWRLKKNIHNNCRAIKQRGETDDRPWAEGRKEGRALPSYEQVCEWGRGAICICVHSRILHLAQQGCIMTCVRPLHHLQRWYRWFGRLHIAISPSWRMMWQNIYGDFQAVGSAKSKIEAVREDRRVWKVKIWSEEKSFCRPTEQGTDNSLYNKRAIA